MSCPSCEPLDESTRAQYLSRHGAPNEYVVVEPGANDDALRRAVLDCDHASNVSFQHPLALHTKHPSEGVANRQVCVCPRGVAGREGEREWGRRF